MDARAIHEEQLVDGVHRSTLEELTDWTIWADKIISSWRGTLWAGVASAAGQPCSRSA